MKNTYEQESAINKRNSNVLVAASAGSGKTSVLIERVIKRIIEDEIDVDKILVVTFTNASALELKQRLQKRLKKELKENEKKSSFIKRQLRLLNNSDISTIHAFCLKLIRQNFDVLNLDPNFVICDESKKTILQTKAISLVLEEEYKKKENEQILKLLQLFNYKEEDLIEEILNVYTYIQSFEAPLLWLKNSIEKYNEIGNITDLFEFDYGKYIVNDVIDKLKMLSLKIDEKQKELCIYEDLSKIRAILIEDLEKIDDVILNFNNSWNVLYEKINSIEFSKMPRYSGVNLELKEEISNFRKNVIKQTIINIKEIIYADTKQIILENMSAYEYISYLYYLIVKFYEKYNKLKSDKNCIDFSDIEHYAYSLLIKDGNVTDLAISLKEQYEEIYTDEYQDTSFIQEAILQTLSSGNNRFMVGDIKQSIYRFRQASPQIFNKKSKEYNMFSGDFFSKEDTKIVLSKNFRSSKSVIDSINFIFENIMSMEAGDSNYTLADVLKCGKQEDEYGKCEKSELNILNLKEFKNTYEKMPEEIDEEILDLKEFEIESNFIAKRIKELVENEGKKYSDIVILLRNVTNRVSILENILKNNGIDVFSDVASSIFDSEEVKLVLSFLRVLNNKYQDINLVAIMYSVIGMFNLDELVKIRYTNKKCKLWDCLKIFVETEKEDIKLVNKVINFIELIQYYENKVNKISIGELLIDLYHNTGIYYQFLLDEKYKQRKANLDLILDMCVNFEKQNGSFLNEYISYIDNMKNKADSSTAQAKTIGENENVVRIMTIHKSKGLEFNTVILADCSRKYNYKELKNKFVLHSNLGIGINIVDKNYNVCYPSLIKQAIKEQVVKEIKNEELRLLYVALTRAKSKLIIFATTKDYIKLEKELFIMKTKTTGAVEPYAVLQNDSYIKNILMAIKNDNRYLDYFKFNVIDVNKYKDYLVKEKLEENEIFDFENINYDIKDKKIINLKQALLKRLVDCNMHDNISQRVSVSELKSSNNVKYEISNKVPSCIDEKSKKITPARKGTLVHFILQILDFKSINSKQDIKDFIDKSEKQHVISLEDKKYINIDSIYEFFTSNIGKQIKNSNNVYKEKEFILKNNSFTKSSIQGIIDLYYEVDGKIVLVDFKTDNILDDNEYIKLYKKQLDIYKEALEKLTTKKVDKVYIYSFRKGKEIEVV